MDIADHTLAVFARECGESKGEMLRRQPDLKIVVENCENIGRAEAGKTSPMILLEEVVHFAYAWGFQAARFTGVPPDNVPFLASGFQFGWLDAYLRFYYPDKVNYFEEHYNRGIEHGRRT
ncbi:MAG: hypothetical protein A2730_03910 [Candidatus Staskawiczbacteria bacterium RIFCSPHIGHO2_01_FULL_39_25]|uniref:Uncharacterized protein n=1 Tax=Candidatus Staskawiczbacteria bacterium RIFCSPHIGHO2_01_FULL_39_25 TaxID=1802202 RepID=A0A1G2HPC7_9BACT|nr:hypothetical protein [Candidatus Woesearchaeota archaeon]OGZ64392.1 MAG: hypothetical protein A2730_03910 [Candidatus Staskawiczbacteria bacterium RIFCSPHIGHO2_01_FULL_39_25]